MLNKKAMMATAAFNPAWDISYAQFVPINVGNVSKASYTRVYDTTARETDLRGIFFSPDGLSMYTIGYGSVGLINNFSLSTAWNISSASYVRQFNVSSQEPTPQDLFFKPDGTKMYVIGVSNNSVYEYSLSTAWDISSASYTQVFSVASQESDAASLFFKSDGTKMYVVGYSGDDVNEYLLSTAWDISTASYVQNFSVASQELTPQGLWFNPEGTKMYIIGSSGNDVNEYSLSTAWDISTATYVQVFSVSSQLGSPACVVFSPDMVYMYVGGSAEINQYTLNQGFSVAAQETEPYGLFFKPDGTKMYVIGTTGDRVNEYDLSSAWDISTASYVQNFSVSGQEAAPRALFFKPDGTKMYVIGTSGDDVNEYTLSSAWNISTASYVQVFSVSSQETVPYSLFFKPDGTKMYVGGDAGSDVNEYTLSSAWNVSTASYVQNFSVSSQTTRVHGLFFKPDGTKMYVNGYTADELHEYSLSSAWNLSTASYSQSITLTSASANPGGLFFKPDGLSFWMLWNTTDSVYQYNLEA